MGTLHALMARLPLATRADTSPGLARAAGRAPPFPTSGLMALPPPVTRKGTFPGDSLKPGFPSLESSVRGTLCCPFSCNPALNLVR